MDYLQYVEGDSLLHKLDPRTKFIFFLSMAMLTSLVKSGFALVFLLAFFIVLWARCRIMKEMWILFNKLKILLAFIMILWFVIGIFKPVVGSGPVFYQTSFGNLSLSVDWYDIYKGFVYALRIYLMIASFFTVLITTNFSQIILGLCKWHIPYAVSYAIGLVFQVIPIIITELQTIMEAESSRGLEIEKCGAAQKVKNYLIFSLPLFYRVIEKAHAISLSMHYYKLNFKVRRSSYKSITMTAGDIVFLAITLAVILITAALAVHFYIPV